MSARRLATLALSIVAVSPAAADDTKTWTNIGEIGGPVLWVAGLASSLVQDGRLGTRHAARTLDGFIVDGLATEALKSLTRERRPYSTSHDSFPSLHASLSFEVAAAQSFYHPGQAPLWYAAAALISYSRIPAHEHHWQDVVAGSALGYGCGQLSVSSPRGWLVSPILERSRPGLSLSFATTF